MQRQKKRESIYFINKLIYLLAFMSLIFYLHEVWVQKGKPTELGPIIIFCLITVFFFALCFEISLIIHETGHLIFGLLSGYTFLSFRIGSYSWVKQDGKIVFKKVPNSMGLGQCLMKPPADKEKFSLVRYTLGGALLNLIFALLFLVLFFLVPVDSYRASFCLCMILTQLIVGIGNGIPLYGKEMQNDGQNMVDAIRHPETRKAYWTLLMSTVYTTQGKTAGEYPEDWFEKDLITDPDDSISSQILPIYANHLMDQNRYSELITFAESLDYSNPRLPAADSDVLKAMNFQAHVLNENENLDTARSLLRDPDIIRSLYALQGTLKGTGILYAAARLENEDELARNLLNQFDILLARDPWPNQAAKEKERLEQTKNIFGS